MSSTMIVSTVTSPMSSIFTPPSSCATHWTYEAQAANSVSGGLLIQDALAGQQQVACYPPGFGGWGRAPEFIQVFSPGACPVGYSTAIAQYNGPTTTAVCCSSRYGYLSTLSTIRPANVTADFYGCTSTYNANAGPTTVFAEADGTPSILDGTTTDVTAVSGPITMWAQPLTIAFQQSDLSLFASSTSTSSSTQSSSPTQAATSSALSSSNSQSASVSSTATQPSGTLSHTSAPSSNLASSDLSGGDIAGIAVGAAAVLGIIVGVAILLAKRRAPKNPLNSNSNNVEQMSNPYAENGSHGVFNTAAVFMNRFSRTPQELPDNKSWKPQYAQELESNDGLRHELPVSSL